MNDLKAHSEFSMSGFSRTAACPASIPLSKKAPPPVDHPSGIQGTNAHTCLETFLKNLKKPYIVKGMLLKTYPEEMVVHAHQTRDKLVALRDSIDPKAPLMSETRLDTSHITEPGNFGTTDCLIPSTKAKTLVVADFKYGVMPVEVRDNWQLVGYALAALKKFDYAFKYVHQVVIQPRGRTTAPKLRAHISTARELREWEPKFLKAVARTKVKNPVVNPGSHCFFCPARGHTCPAHEKQAVDRALDDFEDLEIEDDWLTKFLKPKKRG